MFLFIIFLKELPKNLNFSNSEAISSWMLQKKEKDTIYELKSWSVMLVCYTKSCNKCNIFISPREMTKSE